MKRCSKCKKNKDLYEFFARRDGGNDGRRSHCKSCMVSSKTSYRNSDLKKYVAGQVVYYRANSEKIKAKQSIYQKSNRGKVNAKIAKYRASKLRATPLWLTKSHINEMEQLYIEANDLSWLSEGGLEVDHIIPLQGKSVSGLHVPWNLQILPKSMNRSKGNKF